MEAGVGTSGWVHAVRARGRRGDAARDGDAHGPNPRRARTQVQLRDREGRAIRQSRRRVRRVSDAGLLSIRG